MASMEPQTAARYRGYASRVHEVMKEALTPGRTEVVEAWRHTLATRGKMLRAAVMLNACSAVGGHPEQILVAAAGVEYGHLASLVHDDIMDRAETRRGQESVYSRFGADRALLLGDLLVFQSYLSLSACANHGVPAERIVRALAVISQSCMEMCLGQDLEIETAGRLMPNDDTYFQISRLKTGALFRAAGACGAILGGGTPDEVASISQYGEQLGICFQIVDDVLNYRVTDVDFGKPVLNDLINKRMTLPILLAFRRAAPAQLQLIDSYLRQGAGPEWSEEGLRSIAELVSLSGAIEEAMEAARFHAAVARHFLHRIPKSESRDCMEEMLAAATERFA